MKLLYSKLLSKHLIRYVEIHVRSFRLSPNTTVDMAESRHHEPVVKLQQQLYHYDHEIETMSMDTHNVVPGNLLGGCSVGGGGGGGNNGVP